MSAIVKTPASSAFVVSYFDTLSEPQSRKLIQQALKAIANLQGIACVCIDHIELPEDIEEASLQLGAYTTADLIWFHFSEHSIMRQKDFDKAICGLFAHAQLGSPVWIHQLPDRYRHLYKDPWSC